jgi:hypothetical protein
MSGVHSQGFLDGAGFDELMYRYEAWRQRWASLTGNEPSRDSPELADGRLWFRDGYPHPDWTAWVIEPNDIGYLVKRVTTERTNTPRISVEAVYSRLDDAGKRLIVHIGDLLRVNCGAEPLYRRWQRSGLSDDLEKGAADERVSEFIAEYNNISPDVVRQLLHKYSLKLELEHYAYLPSSDEPISRILTLSYGELDSMLMDGL